MALLCSAVAAQRHLCESHGFAPQVIYCTRTHSQVKQIVKEVRKSPYLPWVQIIGSREQGFCSEADVLRRARDDSMKASDACRTARNQAESRARNQALIVGASGRAAEQSDFPTCNAWAQLATPETVKGAHGQMRATSSRDLGTTQGILDVEDLGQLGRNLGACPYFLSRAALAGAELVICPYNYVLEPSIASTTGLLEGRCVVIIDEGHNIEDACLEAGSVTSTADELQEVWDRVHAVRQYIDSDAGVIASRILEAIERIHQMCSELHTSSERQAWRGNEDRVCVKTWTSTLENSDTPDSDTVNDFFGCCQVPLDFAGAISKLLDMLKYHGGRGRMTGLVVQVSQILSRLEELAKKLEVCRERPNQYKICLELVRSYRPPPAGSQVQRNSQVGGREGGTFSWELSVLLMSPEAVFQTLSEAAHCVIISSGTLAPTASFSAELGRSFSGRLLRSPVEAPHIIESSQLGLAFVGRGLKGTELKCVREQLSQEPFLRELGCTVLSLIEAIPGGVLIFLPSRSVLDDFVRVLKTTRHDGRSLWDWLVEKKRHVAVEGADVGALEHHERAAVEDGSAVLFCVHRGRSSEGMSLSDHAVRGVICVGIPLAPLKATVRLKRDYNDALMRTLPSGLALDGNEWYYLGAYRAVNQALGRAVRHRHDFGAILLVDSRWTSPGSLRAAKYLPRWLRQLVGIRDTARGETLPQLEVSRLVLELRPFFERLMATAPQTDAAASAAATAAVLAGSEGDSRRVRARV
jgi:DNA repair helicase Rad3